MFSRKSLVASRWSLVGAALALLLVSADAEAGVMDFKTLEEAKHAYEVGNYTKASELYGKLHGKNAQARYNYGDALYKQKKYKEAAEVFKQIDDPALKHKALHNLGNALANSGKTDEAIKAYEEALKLEDDKDTRYNLELLKKQKKQQQKQNKKNQKNKDQKNKQQNKDQQQDQNKNGQNQQNDQNKKGQNQQNDKKQQKQDQNDRQNNQQNNKQDQEKRDQQQSGQGQSSSKQNEKRQSQNAEQKKKEQQDKKEREQDKMQQAAAKAQPISDMEERKYNQMLKKRGIKTLMVPLKGKGEPKNDETTPW